MGDLNFLQLIYNIIIRTMTKMDPFVFEVANTYCVRVSNVKIPNTYLSSK